MHKLRGKFAGEFRVIRFHVLLKVIANVETTVAVAVARALRIDRDETIFFNQWRESCIPADCLGRFAVTVKHHHQSRARLQLRRHIEHEGALDPIHHELVSSTLPRPSPGNGRLFNCIGGGQRGKRSELQSEESCDTASC